MADAFTRRQKQLRKSTNPCTTTTSIVKGFVILILCVWMGFMVMHVISLNQPSKVDHTGTVAVATSYTNDPITVKSTSHLRATRNDIPFEETDDSYHIVFSTGCSEFQDWQSIGVYSSAEAVGQRGIITRIASGCTPSQEASLRHAMSHLPKRCRIHFAPDTDVKDHNGHFYKYANKPLGMMHWLQHAEPKIPPEATVALVDPDFFFLRPLWHDSFDSPDKYIATGRAKKTPMPRDPVTGKVRVTKGSMIAQRYGIGGKPWTKAPGKNGQKAWALDEYFSSIGRSNSPALAPDLLGHEDRAGDFYSIGAPYIALASDWLPIATNWTALMYMAVERNFGNLAEMYAMVIAVADYGIRPTMIDSMMVSNVGAGDEGWPWIDALPMDRGCDPSLLTDMSTPLPTFLHYCQTYRHPDLTASHSPGSLFSKYQVPADILTCPEGSETVEGGKRKSKPTKMTLDSNGFLPEPDIHTVAKTRDDLRHTFSHCFATRGTNRAARDYRRWFCSEKRNSS